MKKDNNLTDELKKKDKEFDEKMEKMDEEIEALKNTILKDLKKP
ncbi:hypothetical protein [Rossellomorea aquimaris]|nr:hypothetical protein [Rossellomorea aquimaris]